MGNDRHRMARRRELADVRSRLVAHLQQTIGPAMSADKAQLVLEQARAWHPVTARELDAHIADHPDALTAPSPHCPHVLVRLLRQLELAGHGDAVTQLACAGCGVTSRDLLRPTPEGRICNSCGHLKRLVQCSRCHRSDYAAARREEGPICRRCYSKDPLYLKECAGCGQRKRPSVRREDGTVLCPRCAPRPRHPCARCGNLAPATVHREEGPICRACYESPPRLCGICGETRSIAVRARGDQPDICVGCQRGPLLPCTVCGRVRHCYRATAKGGAFHCRQCFPRTLRPCNDCGKTRRVTAIWPIGVLCGSCYARRKNNPMPCSRCADTRVLVGRTAEGDDLCGPCSGADDLVFACRRCGFPGDIYADGLCSRCAFSDRLQDLLSHEDGTTSPQLRPLAEALIAAARPRTVLAWVRRSPSAKLLATLAAQGEEITHELLDELPQERNTRYVREVLVSTGVLPHRQEELARLELWLRDVLGKLPPHQLPIIRPFAEWHILRDARRKAARGQYTPGSADADRVDIRHAVQLLDWLDKQHLDLKTVTQADMDLWLTDGSARYRGIASFARWAAARGLTSKLVIPTRKSGLPSQFLGSEQHHEQLLRCLNDDTLPLDVRIAGALIRLYALPTTRIVQITVDQFHRDHNGAYLTLQRHPVLLPPKLARLIEQQIASPQGYTSSLQQPHEPATGYLLPGLTPSRPRNAPGFKDRMRRHGLPVLSARNTAMIEAATDLPPTVISDLFGIHPSTAHTWAQYANDSWAHYLAAQHPRA